MMEAASNLLDTWDRDILPDFTLEFPIGIEPQVFLIQSKLKKNDLTRIELKSSKFKFK